MDRVIDIAGVVTEFRFRNPHSQLFFDAVDEQGNVEKWVVELNSPSSWIRAGWTQQIFKPGDRLSFKMHPSRSGANVGFPASITLPDGRMVTAAGNLIEPASDSQE